MKTIMVTPEFIQGAVSIEEADGYTRPWRTDYRLLDLFPSINDVLVRHMEKPVGVRLRFTSESDHVTLSSQPCSEDRLFDLVIDNELRTTSNLPAGETDITFYDLPGDTTPIEIWPGYAHPILFTGIRGENVLPVDDTRVKWLTYGSSITQCDKATSPARSWPGTAARLCNLHLTCMGFSGQCHLDSMVARLIRDRDVDMVTLKLGINIMGASSLSPRTFKGAVIGFVQIIRENHPDIPIGIISPIISPPRETTPNTVNFTLQRMRDELADAVDRMQRVSGDNQIVYFNGLNLFGKDLVDDYLPDNLHPNGDGYELMGKYAAKSILPTLISRVRP